GNLIANHYHRRLTAGLNYILARGGLLGMAVSMCGGFIKTDAATHASPDIQVLLMLFSTDRAGPTAHPFPGITVTATLLRPESKGYCRIVSPDPFVAPEIQPNYLAEAKDRISLVEGVKAMREVMKDPLVQRYIVSEYTPGADVVSDEGILDFI